MSHRILVFYGSYRSDRMGIRLAQFVVEGLRAPRRRGRTDRRQGGRPADARPDVQGISARARRPQALEKLAGQIRDADGFVFVTGEYNWGMQPGLKNLTDHFLEEWFWRPAAIASYSAGRFSGARAATRLARHALGDGHGGGFEHDRGGPDCADPVGGRQADRRGRQGAGQRFPRFADDLTGGSRRQRCSGAKEAAVLRAGRNSKSNKPSYPRACGSSAPRASRFHHSRLWNTGSPGQAGR